MSDTGRYKCVAANKAGKHEKEFDVTVHGRLLERRRNSRLSIFYISSKKVLKFSVNIYLFMMRVDKIKVELLLPVGYCFYIFKCICSNDT